MYVYISVSSCEVCDCVCGEEGRGERGGGRFTN